MADEAILTVSLKDYKKQIDDLRASLLSLDNTSKEYQATAEEIKTRQAKLNEVMGIGKQSVDAVAGSYNALSQEMARLKKEWKNMEIGTQQWKDMAKQINDINDKLKEADAEVGVFSRNVGDYANQYTEAFEQCFGEVGKLGGTLGGLSTQIQSLVPQIKKVTIAMKQGVGSVATNLTVIGLLVNIIAKEIKYLIDNWENVRVAFTKGGTEIANQLTRESAQLDKQNELIKQQANLLKARGANSMTVLAEEIAKLQELSGSYADLAIRMEDLYGKKSEKAKEAWDKSIEAVKEFKGKAYEAQVAVEQWLNSIQTEAAQTGLTEIQKALNGITNNSNAAKQAAEAMFDAGVISGTEYLKLLTKIREATLLAAETEKEKAAANTWKQEEEKVKSLLEEIKKASQTEIQNLTDKYNKEKRLMEKHHRDTTLLTKQYNDKILEIQEKAQLESYNKSVEYYNRLKALESPEIQLKMDLDSLKETMEDFEDVMKTGWNLNIDDNKPITKAMTDALKSLKKYGIETEQEFVVAYQELLNKIKSTESEIKQSDLEKWANSTENKLKDLSEVNGTYYIGLYKYYKEYLDKMTKYFGESDEEFANRQKNIKKSAAEALQSAYLINIGFKDVKNEQKIAIDEIINWYENAPHSVFGDIFKLPEGIDEQLEARFVNAEKQYRQFQEYIEEYGEVELGIDLSQFDFETQKEEWYNAYNEILVSLPEEMLSKNIQLGLEYKDSEKALLDQRRQNWFDFANSIGDVLGSIADMQMASIDSEKETLIAQGKTEEEANRMLEGKFEAAKGFQIAQATINTITGAIAAFMGCQELGQPWGLALGIAQAAAVTAAGVAQIAQIKKTTIGSTSGNITSPIVTPRLNDYSPDRVQNITTAEDEKKLQETLNNTNIWVSVEDINSAQNLNKVRVAESTF